MANVRSIRDEFSRVSCMLAAGSEHRRGHIVSSILALVDGIMEGALSSPHDLGAKWQIV